MKITGGKNYIRVDCGNGYVFKASGEMLANRTFIAYKDTINHWESPHENELISQNQLESLLQEIKKNTNESTVQIIFE